jgi:hypothetical protein
MLPFGEAFLKRDLLGGHTKWGAIQGHPQFLITPLLSEPGKDIHTRAQFSNTHTRETPCPFSADQSITPSGHTHRMYGQTHIGGGEEEEEEGGKKGWGGGELTHPACG